MAKQTFEKHDLTYFQIVEDDLLERGVTVIDTTKAEDVILAEDTDGRALFIYSTSFTHDTAFEFDLLSHVSEPYAKTFAYLLRKNKRRLLYKTTADNYFQKIVTNEQYANWKRTSRTVIVSARSARKAGQLIDICNKLPYVSIKRGADDEYFFQGEEASNLINEAEHSMLANFCTTEDIILWQAQGW
jgi:hypothetical protein